jgi:hypothetical protein
MFHDQVNVEGGDAGGEVFAFGGGLKNRSVLYFDVGVQ